MNQHKEMRLIAEMLRLLTVEIANIKLQAGQMVSSHDTNGTLEELDRLYGELRQEFARHGV